MRRGRAWVIGLVVAGCGRIGFEPGEHAVVGPDGGVGPDGTPADARPLGPEVCNGFDDDGDGSTDEQACAGDCSGLAYNGRGYMLCTTSLTAVQSFAVCEAAGMHQIRIDDAAENLFVRMHVDPLPNPQAWIGARDLEVEGEWRWADGTLFWLGNQTGAPVDGLFNAWASSAPDDQMDGEDCAESIPSEALWLDEPCDDASAIDVSFCEE